MLEEGVAASALSAAEDPSVRHHQLAVRRDGEADRGLRPNGAALALDDRRVEAQPAEAHGERLGNDPIDLKQVVPVGNRFLEGR